MINIDEIIKYSKELNLLYIEDNQEARESTLMILEEFFTNIIVATNGEDGYEKFKENDIDLIITDIHMPKLNGIDMIAKIREIDKEISILILSAHHTGSKYFINSIELGVDGYLLKPITLNQFLEVIKKIIQKLKLIKTANKNLHFLKEYQKITDASSIISKTNPEGRITYVNQEFMDTSGYSKDELIGKNHNIVRHPDTPKDIFKDLWDTIKNKKQIWKGIVRNRSKDGKSYYVDTTIKPILDIDNSIIEFIALRHNITDVMNPKRQLDDAVKNSKDPFVLYMKIEDFQILEEFYDNETVERIQDKIGLSLKNNLPKECKVNNIYQLGNGEYAMTNEKSICMDNKDIFLKNLELFRKNIKETSVDIDIDEVKYNMSIVMSLAYKGTYMLESAKLGIREILKTKQDFIISNNLADKIHNKAQKNIKTISMIKKAINEFKIISYFQPIVNNQTKNIEKYESLVRLIDEDGKILSPFFFLDIAKKGKYYSQITNIVLDNSFNALTITNLDISINLSTLDIESKDMRDKIFTLLEKHKGYGSRIVFELLEDEAVKNFKTIINFINEVKKFGVKIAIDDFGAGYSNFERLLDYQPDILKIDACLIKNIQKDEFSLSVVETIVAFAKKQNIKTVGEFVESEKVFNIIRDLGVDYTQGYYFGKPEPLIIKD